jgi:hypothetical protein
VITERDYSGEEDPLQITEVQKIERPRVAKKIKDKNVSAKFLSNDCP